MTEKTGSNHGGKRPNAGRKRRAPWEEAWWEGFRLGNPETMAEADRMRDEAKATATEPPKSTPSAAISADDRSSGANKQRRYRQRRATGLAVYRVVAAPAPLVNSLIESGRLSALDALDRGRVELALGEVISDFTSRWR